MNSVSEEKGSIKKRLGISFFKEKVLLHFAERLLQNSMFFLLMFCFIGIFTVYKIVFLRFSQNLCTEKLQPKYSSKASFNSRIRFYSLTTGNIFPPPHSLHHLTSWEVLKQQVVQFSRVTSLSERPCELRIRAEDADTGSWNPPTAFPELWLYVYKTVFIKCPLLQTSILQTFLKWNFKHNRTQKSQDFVTPL